eukprot:scaffold230_cov353-Prasinococcus_capsulatus_cf.AAC.7
MVLKALASDLPRLPANSKVWVQGTVLLLEGSPPNGTKALVLDDGSGLLHVDMQEYPCDLRGSRARGSDAPPLNSCPWPKQVTTAWRSRSRTSRLRTKCLEAWGAGTTGGEAVSASDGTSHTSYCSLLWLLVWGRSKLTLIPEKLKNITEDPDRETLWFLEIVESRSSLLQGLQAGKSESGGDQPGHPHTRTSATRSWRWSSARQRDCCQLLAIAAALAPCPCGWHLRPLGMARRRRGVSGTARYAIRRSRSQQACGYVWHAFIPLADTDGRLDQQLPVVLQHLARATNALRSEPGHAASSTVLGFFVGQYLRSQSRLAPCWCPRPGIEHTGPEQLLFQMTDSVMSRDRPSKGWDLGRLTEYIRHASLNALWLNIAPPCATDVSAKQP